MYQVHALKAARKDIKKLSRGAANKIVNIGLLKISENPYTGLLLSGKFKNYWKYVFRYKGVSYRIVYQISKNENVILVIAIGPREKFYERLLRRLKG
ncbi:MAG: type II toxin-antitoxin system RelE/ParE family toxin [Patescibacteria group bacterium]|nr:type II toxin-antitoxin system RelE/ParE family toxin [Patescibacteria group bacterium]